jgi:hypothetical protein
MLMIRVFLRTHIRAASQLSADISKAKKRMSDLETSLEDIRALGKGARFDTQPKVRVLSARGKERFGHVDNVVLSSCDSESLSDLTCESKDGGHQWHTPLPFINKKKVIGQGEKEGAERQVLWKERGLWKVSSGVSFRRCPPFPPPLTA